MAGFSMTTTINKVETRLSQLRKEVPSRGIERHPMILKNISELYKELQSPAVTALATEKNIQTIVAFPPQIHHGWTYVPKQALLFTSKDVIHLLASIWPDQEPQLTALNGCDLLYMDVTMILLYGFLEIVANGPNSPTRLNVEFNTVAWYQLSKLLRRLLQVTKATPNEPTDKTSFSPTVTQALEKLPFKFSNGLRIHGLLPGEELEDLVFQTGIWEYRFLVIRKAISANTLLLLTSNFVVVIREKLGFQYGWIVTYIPRENIIGIQNQVSGPFNELTINLKRGEQTTEYKLTLMNEAAQDWRARWIEHGFLWQDVQIEK
jgi:hypothetical protein